MTCDRCLIIALLAVWGCHGDRGDRAATARPTSTDSAGVTVVTSEAAAWPDGGGWRLAEQPSVVIAPDAEDYQLLGVYSAVRLRDGRIVVANSGENRLLFFGSDGRLVGFAGREGRGPGEFRNLIHIWRLRGDSLLAHDWLGARISAWKGPVLGRMARVRSPDAVAVPAGQATRAPR